MSHTLTRGRLVGVRSVTDGICAPAVTDALLTIATDGDERDLSVTPDVAAAIAAAGLLFADVELTLSRADEPSPAVDERRRYLAELDRSTRLERALADAEQALTAERRESAYHARRARECLDVLALLSTWAGAARCGELDADEPTAAGIVDATLREWAVDVYAALHVAHRAAVAAAPALPALDDEPPHGGSADVERVVIAEGVLDGIGPYDVDLGAPSGWVVSLHARRVGPLSTLGAHAKRRARVVVELLPAVERVDAQEGAGDEAGEGVGQGVAGEHGASVTTGAGERQSRADGAA